MRWGDKRLILRVMTTSFKDMLLYAWRIQPWWGRSQPLQRAKPQSTRRRSKRMDGTSAYLPQSAHASSLGG
jgi:hypothetical protein